MRRKQWLINQIDPSASAVSHFDVKEGAVQLTAVGLSGVETVEIQVRVEGGLTRDAGVDHYWTPLWRNGCKVDLRADHNQLLITIPGVYRAVLRGSYAGPVAVGMWEEDRDSDHKIQFIEFAGRDCGAGSGAQSGSTPCVEPPIPLGDTVTPLVRCDAATGAQVTLLIKVPQPDNTACPPASGGAPFVAGYVLADGTVNAGPYPGTLGACGCLTSAAAGVVDTWGA